MKKILERARSIGIRRKEPVALDPKYNNAIDAIKLRIEKEQHLHKILEERRRACTNNEDKRNKVVEMEDMIRRKLREISENRMAKIKNNQFNDYRDAQLKLRHRHRKLRKLEEIEKSMMNKLSNTKSVESYETSLIENSLGSLVPRKSCESYVSDRKTPGRLLYLGRSGSKSINKFSEHRQDLENISYLQ